MVSLSEFEIDLKKAAEEAAEFLRTKSERMSKSEDYDETYSGEREFVAECYRRLSLINKSYIENLTVDYYRYKAKERVVEYIFPDIVFHDSKRGRAAVEVKAIWFMRTRDEGLYKRDKERITRDYKKLRDRYGKFDLKIMLVAFLGKPESYHRNKVKKYVEEVVHGNANIGVITC
jgi:hypothetical protein